MSLVDYPSTPTFSLPGPAIQRRPIAHQPDTAYLPQAPSSQHLQQYPPSTQHRHTRTASSAVFPATEYPPPQQQQLQAHTHIPTNTNAVSYLAHMNQQNSPMAHARRSVSSTNTLSTTTSSSPSVPARHNSGSSLARSASSRSGSSPSSYVALMRKQKATVWSDRAQHEDPRLVAQQRAAKMRAAAEVQKAALNARTSTSVSSSSLTGGVRSKILHHGAARARDYVQTGLPQSGVPIRLSQNEIDENDDDDPVNNPAVHIRSGSGRSSLGSGGRVASMYGMQSYSGTPPSALSGSPVETKRSPRSEDETPVPGDFRRDYFSASGVGRKSPGGTSGSPPDERQFGDLGKLPMRIKEEDPEKDKLSEAELRRRGSVDERTTTMTGYGKLFIANPDA